MVCLASKKIDVFATGIKIKFYFKISTNFQGPMMLFRNNVLQFLSITAHSQILSNWAFQYRTILNHAISLSIGYMSEEQTSCPHCSLLRYMLKADATHETVAVFLHNSMKTAIHSLGQHYFFIPDPSPS